MAASDRRRAWQGGDVRRARDEVTVWRLALVMTVLFVVVLGVLGVPRGHVSTGDTPKLVGGARIALTCIRASQWSRCGLIDAHQSGVREYPLLQYVPVAAMVQAGWSDHRILRALGVLSFIALVATLALVVRAGRSIGSQMWSPVLLAIALTGPLLFYSTSAFGEMLSASLVLACIVAALERRPTLIFLLALIGGLGKETLPLFVFVVGLVVARDDHDHGLPPRRVLLPLLGGSAVSVALAGLFNQFRYGTWGNQNYLQPAFRISRVRAARNLWNLLVAPNGGLIWFWTSISLLLVGLAAVTVLGLRRDARSTLPAVAVLAVFAALMVGLASWYSPFGWVAWGPRLALPMLPALATAAAYAGGDRLSAAASLVLRRTSTFVVVLVIVLAGSWPQAGAPWQADRLARSIQTRDCSVSPRSHSEAFYDCEDRVAWRRRDNQLVEASSGGGAAGFVSQAVLLGAVACLLFEARRRAGHLAEMPGEASDPSAPGAPVRSTM